MAERRLLTLLPDSPERTLALVAIEDRTALDASFWSDEGDRARDAFYPWYIRTPRAIFGALRRLYHRDHGAPT